MYKQSAASISRLAGLSLFAGCGRSELARADQLLTAIDLPAGRVLMKAGDLGAEFAVIVDGQVSVTDDDGRELAVLGKGDLVGEVALLGGNYRNANVTTLTPVTVLVGNRREFYALLDVDPAIRQRVTRAAMTRMAA